ncbi:MAG: tRNA (adenosine(37)-N6)-threonylcarbamoyltransferase complex ATPase subunit type 1 TsaE [Candidatus Krumholzibacteriia bacterium]
MSGERRGDPLQLPEPAWFPRLRTVASAAETRALGRALAGVLAPGQAVALHGPLGAGKTCLVQGLCEGLQVADEVISPTFTLVNRYAGRVVVDHLDFYRIEPDHDLTDIGVEEILDELDREQTLLVVEWPNLLLPLLPVRLELLAELGPQAESRRWYARGVPRLADPVAALFPEANPSCSC